jgi:Xaa-Pro aminopeptidase
MANIIPVSDFRERIATIRSRMRRQNLEALLIFSQKRGHATYVSGYFPNYHTNSAIVFLPLEGEPILWIKFPFDLPRARAASWFSDIRGSVSEGMEGMVSQCADEVRARGFDRSRIGLVGTDLAVDELSSSLCAHLAKFLPGVQFEPASDLVNEVRLVKSRNEIEVLRVAAHIADLGGQEFARAIKPGIKQCDAAVTAECHMRRHGAEECSIIVSSGPSRMALPPTEDLFNHNDIVTCEITARYHGYWAQICRVFTIGKASADEKEIFAACKSGYEAARAASRAGKVVSAAHQAAISSIKAAGFGDYIQYGAGHGVGLDLPELYPLDPHCHGVFAPGVIMVIHPAIWVPGRGTAFVGGPVAVSDGPADCLDSPQAEIVEI